MARRKSGKGLFGGFVLPWYRRLRWVRRGLVVGGSAFGAYQLARPPKEPGGDTSLGGGTSLVPAPTGGGPTKPSPLRAEAALPAESDSHSGTAALGTLVREITDTDAGSAAATDGPEPAPASADRWVSADGPDAPEGYPIKANENSGIYHVPGGMHYDRTQPERWYESEDAAKADGFRRAKR